jgi:hypothetical protein
MNPGSERRKLAAIMFMDMVGCTAPAEPRALCCGAGGEREDQTLIASEAT